MFNDPQPAGGDSLPLKDIAGHYVIVKALEYLPAFPTSFGATDAIRVNVADLSTGTLSHDVLWFGRAIVPGLRNSIGQPGYTLALVAQGEQKPGQDPPWILSPASDRPEVVAAATAWIAANPGALDGTPITAPALAAPAAPAAAPVQPMAPAPAAGVAPVAAPVAPPVAPAAPAAPLAPVAPPAPPQAPLV